MGELTGLGIAEFIDGVRLQSGERSKGALHNLRTKQFCLNGADDGVASENSHKPRQTGCKYKPIFTLRHHKGLQVNYRLVVSHFEFGIIGLQRRDVSQRSIW